MSKERILGFMADLETRDVANLKKWFAESMVLSMPPSEPVEGARRVLVMFRAIFRMYKDIHWRVADIFQIGENKFVYMTDSWGTIGESTPYKNSILTIIEFDAAGLITFISDYFKDTAIFQAGKSGA